MAVVPVTGSPSPYSATDIKAMSKEEVHRRMLMEKYARIWRTKTEKGGYGSCMKCYYIAIEKSLFSYNDPYFLPPATHTPSCSHQVPFHTAAGLLASLHAV